MHKDDRKQMIYSGHGLVDVTEKQQMTGLLHLIRVVITLNSLHQHHKPAEDTAQADHS